MILLIIDLTKTSKNFKNNFKFSKIPKNILLKIFKFQNYKNIKINIIITNKFLKHKFIKNKSNYLIKIIPIQSTLYKTKK